MQLHTMYTYAGHTGLDIYYNTKWQNAPKRKL